MQKVCKYFRPQAAWWLFFQYLRNKRFFSALNLRFREYSPAGSLFTNEERKRIGWWHNRYYVPLTPALFMTSQTQTAKHTIWQRSRPCFGDFRTSIRENCCESFFFFFSHSIPIVRAYDASSLGFPFRETWGPSRKARASQTYTNWSKKRNSLAGTRVCIFLFNLKQRKKSETELTAGVLKNDQKDTKGWAKRVFFFFNDTKQSRMNIFEGILFFKAKNNTKTNK